MTADPLLALENRLTSFADTAEGLLVYDHDRGLAPRPATDFEGDLYQLIPAALSASRDREALLINTAWNETDGPCWCSESREITGAAEHEPRCAAARAALEASSGGA
jgi:hypothetical protein